MASRGKGKQRAEDAKAKQPAVEVEPMKVNKWDANAVKNALDDTAKKIMADEFRCVEDFGLVNWRLLLCTVACGFSVFALVYDYLNPFPQSRTVLAVCAISYFILMGVLSVYSMMVEGAVFMVARQKDPAGVAADCVWTLGSSLPRFGHLYSMSVDFSDGQANRKGSGKLEESVTQWFDEEGVLVFDKFHADFSRMCKDAEKSGKIQ